MGQQIERITEEKAKKVQKMEKLKVNKKINYFYI
jgi:hypothetical protein